jgi:hypothetical protein
MLCSRVDAGPDIACMTGIDTGANTAEIEEVLHVVLLKGVRHR